MQIRTKLWISVGSCVLVGGASLPVDHHDGLSFFPQAFAQAEGGEGEGGEGARAVKAAACRRPTACCPRTRTPGASTRSPRSTAMSTSSAPATSRPRPRPEAARCRRGPPGEPVRGVARRSACRLGRRPSELPRHRDLPLLRRPDRGGRRPDQFLAAQRVGHRLRRRQQDGRPDQRSGSAGLDRAHRRRRPEGRRGRRHHRLARHRVPPLGPGPVRYRPRCAPPGPTMSRVRARTTAAAPISTSSPSNLRPTSTPSSQPGTSPTPTPTPRGSSRFRNARRWAGC